MAGRGSAPDVSIICTVKNGKDTVGEMIDSILAQTLCNWELVIVDDGSDDGTADALGHYAAEDPRIVPVFTDGVGRGQALNRAISCVRARLVCNVDADDMYHPQRLEIQMAMMASHPEYCVTSTDTILLSCGEKPMWRLADYARSTGTIAVSDITREFAYHNPIAHSSVMMRGDSIASAGGYDARRRAQLDYDLWMRLVELGGRIGNVEYPLTARRMSCRQSFESRSHLRYVCSSISIQARGIRSQRAGLLGWGLLIARLPWCICPRSMRLAVRGLYQGRKHRRLAEESSD